MRNNPWLSKAFGVMFVLMFAFVVVTSYRLDQGERQRSDLIRQNTELVEKTNGLTEDVRKQSDALLCYSDTSNDFFALVARSLREQRRPGATDDTEQRLEDIERRLAAARAKQDPCAAIQPGG